MLAKLALGVSVFTAADGARALKKNRGTTKVIGGVPVHNYHLAFQQNRWDGVLQSMDNEMPEGKERWVVMMRPGMSAAELEAVCAAHASCDLHGHSAVPFLELRASGQELVEMLWAEKGNVEFAEPDMPMSATPDMPSTQAEVPWGLRRVRARSLDALPKGDPGKANGGKGVHVYVLDTGIRTTHVDFEDRAIPGAELGWFNRLKACNGNRNCAVDAQGHGTHCAGTVGGRTYGVAKGALIYAVKVLNDIGSGSTAGIISGMDWVADNAQSPAVASMSLGGGFSNAMNAAVDEMTTAGVTVVTASGNSNDDSCLYSPGAADSAINVGSTDPNDDRSSFSNYGSCQQLYAPGRSVLSADSDSDTGGTSKSGTSMACPHVAGAAALLLQAAPTLQPAEVKAKLLQEATPDAVTLIPTYNGGPNMLLYLGE